MRQGEQRKETPFRAQADGQRQSRIAKRRKEIGEARVQRRDFSEKRLLRTRDGEDGDRAFRRELELAADQADDAEHPDVDLVLEVLFSQILGDRTTVRDGPDAEVLPRPRGQPPRRREGGDPPEHGLVLVLQLPLLGLASLVGTSAFATGVVAAVLIVLAVTLVCSLYPAALAARLEPADALRYE